MSSNVKIHANGTVELCKEDYDRLIEQSAEMRSDLGLIKQRLYQILEKAGMFNKDGTFREKPNITSILGMATKAMSGKGGNEFSFLSDLLPLYEKYKDF